MVHSSAGLALELRLLNLDAIRPHGGPQNFRQQNTAVGLLEILHDRHPGAAYGQATSVQGVYKLGLVLALGTITDIRPAGLKRLEVRAGRNLAEQCLSRQPYFDVISLG